MRANVLFSLLVFLAINITGCQSNSSSNDNVVYQKKEQKMSVQTEPRSYRKYALVSSGNIEVKKSLSTDGPLADVHANGEVKARSLSLDISGRITSSNNLEGSLVRSFDYTSPLDNDDFYPGDYLIDFAQNIINSNKEIDYQNLIKYLSNCLIYLLMKR